jgi:hypothetical protein
LHLGLDCVFAVGKFLFSMQRCPTGLWLQSRSMGGKEVDGVGCGIVGR